jgi:hypothetical protein
MSRVKSLRVTLILFLLSSLITSPSASALTSAEATTLLNNCISAINDPLYTRATLPAIIGYVDAAAIESAIAAGSLGVYIANGAGVIPNSGSANGNAPDLFCGDSNDNQVGVMDSNTSSQDFFFGGGGNDSLTGTMWFSSFYGGPGNDYANNIQERSTFRGGPGNDTYTTLSADSTFEQGTDDNTAPTFPSAETFNTPENSTSVGIITTSESATITIFGGEDQAKFSISRTGDSSTALSFVSAPNFEAPTDVGSNNTYVVVFRAVDAASNAGYETVTVTVTDVVETSTFNSFALSGSATYRRAVTINANVSVSSRVTFRARNVIIAGCKNKVASGSGSSFSATCSWRPSARGAVVVTAIAVPISAGISSTSATPISVMVGNRSGNR